MCPLMHNIHESLGVLSPFGKLKTVMQQEEKERRATFLLPAKVKTTQTVGEAHAHTHRDKHTHSRGTISHQIEGKKQCVYLIGLFQQTTDTAVFSNILQYYLF